jgi:hypothetical protein
MKKLIAALAAVAALATSPTLAQEQERTRKLELAPLVGAYVATGDQRDLLDDALLVGVTASYDVLPYVAVVGSFGWAATQAKGLTRDQDLDLFQYDLGVQGQYDLALGNGLTLQPFVGAGVGARTYSFRDLDVDAETDFAGYVALGGALHYRAAEVSLTARDYLTPFDGIGPEADSSTRNDLGLFASIGARF